MDIFNQRRPKPTAMQNPAYDGSQDNLHHDLYSRMGAHSSDCILSEEEKRQQAGAGEKLRDVGRRLQERARKGLTRKLLYRRLPVLQWLPRYSADHAVGDLVAGVTVGLTVIPQSLAYANIAGLPPQYGLYGSFLGCFIYIILGGCKDVPIGPSAIMSLMTYQTVKGAAPEYAILLSFLVGVVQILMGIAGLGFVIDFISGPVSSGFTSAAALIIFTSQVKDVLGISTSGNTFVEMWKSIVENAHGTKLGDTVMGIVCIIVLLLMRLLTKANIGPSKPELQSNFQRVVNKTLWVIGTSRNAILVILGGIVGSVFVSQGTPPFKVIGEIPAGLPDARPPPFGFTSNATGTPEYVSFLDMCSYLGSGLIVLPLVGLLETIAICKAFSDGRPVDATQELVALGVCNIGNSFVQAFPVPGALSRSAVLNSSGVKTTLEGLYAGLLVILALLFFTPYFFFIPKATLGAIIIAAVIFMVEYDVIVPMWRVKKADLVPGLGTFIACLVLPLELGIIVGIGLNILFILYHVARPKIASEVMTTPGGVEYLMLTPDRCLIFPSVDYVRNIVTKYSLKKPIPVVIDCSHIYGADFTAAKVIECITQDFSNRKQPLFFFNMKPSIVNMFRQLGPKEFIVYDAEEQLDDLVRAHSKDIAASRPSLEISVVATG